MLSAVESPPYLLNCSCLAAGMGTHLLLPAQNPGRRGWSPAFTCPGDWMAWHPGATWGKAPTFKIKSQILGFVLRFENAFTPLACLWSAFCVVPAAGPAASTGSIICMSQPPKPWACITGLHPEAPAKPFAATLLGPHADFPSLPVSTPALLLYVTEELLKMLSNL